MVKKVLISTGSLLLLLFLIGRLFFFQPGILETLTSYTVYPFLWTSKLVTKPIDYLVHKRQSYEQLLSRNKQLSEERDEYRKKLIALQAISTFDAKSKEIISFQKRYDLHNAITSKILLKTFTPNEHSIIVNCGSRHGVQKDMAAIYKFQLLGKVTQVLPWYSKVTLITDRLSKVSAFTNTSNASGIVQGENKINECVLSYISHLKKLHQNDLILSSGQGLVFPEGFCLGKIVDFKAKDVCYNVKLEPLIDFRHLEMCLLTNIEKMDLF